MGCLTPSSKTLNHLDTSQTFPKPSRSSGNLPNSPETFRTIQIIKFTIDFTKSVNEITEKELFRDFVKFRVVFLTNFAARKKNFPTIGCDGGDKFQLSHIEGSFLNIRWAFIDDILITISMIILYEVDKSGVVSHYCGSNLWKDDRTHYH